MWRDLPAPLEINTRMNRVIGNIRTDMSCPAKSNVESAAGLSREDTITLHTAEVTMPGAVVVTWKIPNLAL